MLHHIILAVRCVLFFFIGISLWVTGTLFHGFLWWTLGLAELPRYLPFANLMFLPVAFWFSWQIVLGTKLLTCPSCRTDQELASTGPPIDDRRAAA
ncbi:MAG: hypothetical protein OEV00_03340 [Acidobacteriota bacterium]|nr:hypothetical protein [Acidobacteriota bacterium]MDH3784344.1 hypothetical protein [Acidobacteriota bacterium]